MAVNVETPESVSNGDGATASFAAGFTFKDAADVVVHVRGADGVLALKVNGVDYDLSGSASTWPTAGANVVFRAGKIPASGTTVLRRRVTAAAQAVPFGDQAAFRPTTNEDAFDRVTRQVQEERAKTARAVTVRPGETGLELPAVASRASRLFGFDAAGRPVTDRSLAAFDADVAAAAADADAAAADRAAVAADRLAIEQLAASAEDAPSVLNKLNLDGTNMPDAGTASTLRFNIGVPNTGIVSFMNVLTPSERSDLLAGTNALFNLTKLNNLLADADEGVIVDVPFLRGNVELDGDIFSGIVNRPGRLRTGAVRFLKNFTGGAINVPSNLIWEWQGTEVVHDVATYGQLTSILGDMSPSLGLVQTALSYASGTAAGASGGTTVTLQFPASIQPGALVLIVGIRADTNLVHTLAADISAGATTFGFAASTPPASQTIGNSYCHLLIGTEVVIAVTDTSGVATVVQRGAHGTTAQSHLAGATVTFLSGFLTRCVSCVGTTLTVRDPLPRSFTGATVRAGTINSQIVGRGLIDGGFNQTGTPAPWMGLAATLADHFTVSGDIRLHNASHGGVMLYGCYNSDLAIDTIFNTGKISAGTGASVWVFGESFRNRVRVRLATTGSLGFAIDNKSFGSNFYGLNGPPILNSIEIDDLSNHINPGDLTGGRDNRVRIGKCGTTAALFFDDSASQNTTPEPAVRNIVQIDQPPADLEVEMGGTSAENVVILAGESRRRKTLTLNLAVAVDVAANDTEVIEWTHASIRAGDRVTFVSGAVPDSLVVRVTQAEVGGDPGIRMAVSQRGGIGAVTVPTGNYVFDIEGTWW